MARLFTAASTEYLSVAATPVASPPITVVGWVRSTAAAGNRTLVSLGSSSANQRHLLYYAPGGSFFAFSGNGGTFGQSGLSYPSAAGVWVHLAAVFSATNSRVAYANGTAASANTTNVSVAYDRVYVGAYYTNGGLQSGFYNDGDIAEVGIYSAALSSDEIAALAKDYTPDRIRPGALEFYAPVFGRHSPELEIAGGNNLTVTGATQSDHPPVIRRRRAQIFVPKVVGGTTDTAIDADGAATGTATGASTLSSALSAVGEATGTLEGATGEVIVTSDLDAAGTTAATATGAAVVSSALSAAGEATGTLEATTFGVSAADLSAAGAATATTNAAVITSSNLSAVGEATGTLVATDIGSFTTTDLDADGAATANATGASLIDTVLDATGTATGTAAAASIASSDLSAAGEAIGTLEGTEISGYETADLSAAGEATATAATSIIVASDLSAAGTATAIADTGGEAENAYLTWGAHARRMRIDLDMDDEELVLTLPTLLPLIMKGQRHGKSNARQALRGRR